MGRSAHGRTFLRFSPSVIGGLGARDIEVKADPSAGARASCPLWHGRPAHAVEFLLFEARGSFPSAPKVAGKPEDFCNSLILSGGEGSRLARLSAFSLGLGFATGLFARHFHVIILLHK